MTFRLKHQLKTYFSHLVSQSKQEISGCQFGIFGQKCRLLILKCKNQIMRIYVQQLSKFKIKKFFSTFWHPLQASEMSADDDSNSKLNLTYWFNVLGAGSFWCWLLQTPRTLNQQAKFKFELESSSALISEAYSGHQKVEKNLGF